MFTNLYQSLLKLFSQFYTLNNFNQRLRISINFNQLKSTSTHFNQFQPTLLTKSFNLFQFQPIFTNFYQSPSKLFLFFYTLNNSNELLHTSTNFNKLQPISTHHILFIGKSYFSNLTYFNPYL